MRSPGIHAGGLPRLFQHGLSRLGQPQKLFAMGPISVMSVRSSAARGSSHRSISRRLGGVNDPIYDAEIIALFWDLLNEIKIKESLVKINSIGCRICRPIYKKQLTAYYKNHENGLCEDCQRRLKVNPLKLLDCKESGCIELKEKAPNFLDKLCVMCSAHFKSVLEYLDEVKIPYELDHHLVRGLDYYSRTVFEMYAEGNEAQIGAFPPADGMTTSWKRSVAI